MAFEVLLRRSIEGVGKVGDVVRVKNGYARNYLLPKGYAAVVSDESLREINKDKKVEAVRLSELAKYHTEVAEQLEQIQLTIEARAGEDGHLYGSVGVKQVLDAFSALDFNFEARQVRFEPVRELGEYVVPLHLSRELAVDVKLWVVQDAAEAVELAEVAEAAAEREAIDAEMAAEERAEEQAGAIEE